MAVRKLRKLLLTIIAAYLSLVALVFFFQRSMLYFPSKEILPPSQYGLNNFTEEFLKSSDGITVQAWFKPAAEGKATIVYFHGNGDNIRNRANRFSEFAANGYGVLALSYRGYAKSEGKPTEQGIYSDARAVLDFAKAKGIAENNLILYGESLGSGVAVQMATEMNPKFIALEAPYTSIGEVAQKHYYYLPAKYITLDKFDSLSKIANVKAPVLIMHGELDNIVPVAFGKILSEKANDPKKLALFEGVGHVALTPKQIVDTIVSFGQEKSK